MSLFTFVDLVFRRTYNCLYRLKRALNIRRLHVLKFGLVERFLRAKSGIDDGLETIVHKLVAVESEFLLSVLVRHFCFRLASV